MRQVVIILILAAASALWPAWAQEQPALPYQVEFEQEGRVALANHDGTGRPGLYVTLQFRVRRSADGHLVRDVAGEEIVVEEDGRPVTGAEVRRPELAGPVNAVLAIDTSGSMAEHGKLAEAKRAARLFIERLNPDADCGLILFDHRLRDAIAPAADAATRSLNRRRMRERIEAARPGGGTAYLDATARAVELLRGRVGRRAVVLLTDGVDLNSRHHLAEVSKLAQVAGVPVYTLGVGEPGKAEPVTTVLVLDHSGSMRQRAEDRSRIPKMVALHRAAVRFTEIMRPGARTTLLPFSTVVETPGPFSANKTALREAVERLAPDGETALFDAAHAAVETLAAARPIGKRAVVVLTDGIDNRSRHRPEEVIARARAEGSPLHLLGLGRPGELNEPLMRRMAAETGGSYHHARNEQALVDIFEELAIELHDDGIDEDSLRRLAAQTGGRYQAARDVSQLPLIYENLAEELQATYAVTFPSQRPSHDGTARGITIRIVRGGVPLSAAANAEYQVRGVVVPEMDAGVYLGLLGLLIGLLALPRAWRAATRPSRTESAAVAL